MAVLSHAAVEPNHENYLAINYQITVIILKLNIHCILSFGCNECDVSKQMHENTKRGLPESSYVTSIIKT